MVQTRSWSRSLAQILWDTLGIPFRLLLMSQERLPEWGWTTLEQERIRAVFPHLRGRVLDVGAGANTLIKTYSNGVGVDVVDRGGGTLQIKSCSQLPFNDHSFDTVCFLASLNYVPDREAVLTSEITRVLRPGGRLVITMINPLLGCIGHAFWSRDEDTKEPSVARRKANGLWISDVIKMCKTAQFELICHKGFVYGLNRLLVFRLGEHQ